MWHVLPSVRESLCETYCVPENSEMLNPPSVKSEIWKAMDKRVRSYDRLFQEIQGLLASGLVPTLQLAKILKPAILANQDAKRMVSDSLTLLSHVQYNLISADITLLGQTSTRSIRTCVISQHLRIPFSLEMIYQRK